MNASVLVVTINCVPVTFFSPKCSIVAVRNIAAVSTLTKLLYALNAACGPFLALLHLQKY